MKYYVVWKGRKPGIYDNWEECKAQIEGYSGAVYKSFKTLEQAQQAFESSAEDYLGKKENKSYKTSQNPPVLDSIVVDAACSGNPGDMEYRGLYLKNGKLLFHKGPFKMATNNIGEFLAIVHALAYLKKYKSNIPVYSDSQIAINWVKQKHCKTNLEKNQENKEIFDLIHRAELWLKNNQYKNPVLKWDTDQWGEIPADFGRK